MERRAFDRFLELDRAHFWRIAKRKLILELVDRWAPSRESLRFLDVGAAYSLLGKELDRRGEAILVEPDSRAAAFVRDVFELDVREASLPGPLPVEGRFDVVTAIDVLEHIREDVEAVRTLETVLKPDGVLLVTVPALPCLWSSHDESLHHVRRYTRRTLRRTLETGGVRIERLSYYTSLLLPNMAVSRLLDRLRRPKKPVYRVRMPPRLVNAIGSVTMALERRVLRSIDLPIGGCLFAVARPARASKAGPSARYGSLPGPFAKRGTSTR